MRIFAKPLIEGELVVAGDEHHYLARVRRAAVGDEVELVDGEGRRARGVIARIGERDTALRVDRVEAVRDAPPRVRVLLPLIKGDRMDTCLEKLVEVGADEIVIWPAARAVVRLDGERLATRLHHYRAALQAAARQSGRATVPSLAAVDSLAAAIAGSPPTGRVLLDPAAERGALPAGEAVTLMSGPEGGLAPDELDALAASGFHAVGLGPRVLRAETAPVIAVALIRHGSNS